MYAIPDGVDEIRRDFWRRRHKALRVAQIIIRHGVDFGGGLSRRIQATVDYSQWGFWHHQGSRDNCSLSHIPLSALTWPTMCSAPALSREILVGNEC